MWPVTTAKAARILGVPADTLRRWVRNGNFAHVAGCRFEALPGQIMKQHLYEKQWVVAVAAELKVTPDFTVLEEVTSPKRKS